MGVNKKFLSLIIFSFFLICAGGSFDESSIWLIAMISIIALTVLTIASIIQRKKWKKFEVEMKRKEERKKDLQKRIEQEKELEFSKLKDIFSYNIDRCIEYGYNKYIFVNENEKKIMLNQNIYNFTEIIDFNVTDNSKVVFSPTTSSTSTDTGNMLGRAIVGGVLAGGIGAMIGGATAKKNTTTSGSESHTKHTYIINVTIDSISTPTIKLLLGNNIDKTNEICSLFTVIINRNKQ